MNKSQYLYLFLLFLSVSSLFSYSLDEKSKLWIDIENPQSDFLVYKDDTNNERWEWPFLYRNEKLNPYLPFMKSMTFLKKREKNTFYLSFSHKKTFREYSPHLIEKDTEDSLIFQFFGGDNLLLSLLGGLLTGYFGFSENTSLSIVLEQLTGPRRFSSLPFGGEVTITWKI